MMVEGCFAGSGNVVEELQGLHRAVRICKLLHLSFSDFLVETLIAHSENSVHDGGGESSFTTLDI